MPWPNSLAYSEAIQNLKVTCGDEELRAGEVHRNPLGLLMPYSGNFADVYQVRGPDGRKWAVKCFTRQVAGLHERYRQIDEYLRNANLKLTVPFSFLDKGLRIGNEWIPVLKMEWVEGFTLNTFVGDSLDKPRTLVRLAAMWGKVVERLRRARVAHADLQHGNVLLIPREDSTGLTLKLVDYDGMFVPVFSGSSSTELGHPCYQHPQRLREKLYNEDIDRFSHLVIYTAVRALAVQGRGLWEKYNNDDNLLFRQRDFEQPRHSKLMQELWKDSDPAVRAMAGWLTLSAQRPMSDVPWLDQIVQGQEVAELSLAEQNEVERTLGRSKRNPGSTGRLAALSDFRLSEELRVWYAGPSESNAWVDFHKLRELTGHTEEVLTVAFSPGGQTLASGSSDGTIRLWNVATGTLSRKLAGYTGSVCSVVFSPDGRTLASGSRDGTIRLWDVATEALRWTLNPHTKWVASVAFSPDGQTLASGSGDKTVRLWDVATGTHWRTLEGHSDLVLSVAFSPDRRTLAAAGADQSITLWDVTTGALRQTLKAYGGWVWSVAFSPDWLGRTLASGCDDGTIRLWDMETGELYRTLVGHSSWVHSVAFSPGGRTLASGGRDKMIRFWDVATGTLRQRLKGHLSGVFSVVFSPDGHTLATGGGDRTVRLWDVATWTLRQTVKKEQKASDSALTTPRKETADPPGTVINSIGMKFVPIPPGGFLMGAQPYEEGYNPREEQLHMVRITRPYFMGMFQVTQAEYAAVMGSNPSAFRGQNRPVEHVTWKLADEFCRRLSRLPSEVAAGRAYRLPTEAEWEYACRARNADTYSFGPMLTKSRANFCLTWEVEPQPTSPVGSFSPNAFGLYDMHGNVWEWCADWFCAAYYGESPIDDPTGPSSGTHHVLRGGSASVMDHECRAAIRGESVSDGPDPDGMRFAVLGDFGLRVVCERRGM